MAYVTQNFYSGQKLTDEHMKHIEAGISTADANATKALDIAQQDHAILPLEIAGKADNWMIEEETGLAYLTSGGKKISSGIMIPNDGSSVGGSGSAGTPYAVQYVFQKLTEEQKAQARENIGAAAPDEIQGITDYEKLENRPKINGKTLEGNLTNDDLGLASPTEEQVAFAVEKWLDEHPEATTTVADGSITPNKTSFILKKQINLYDPSAATVGRFDDATQTDYTTSGYIPVKKTVYSFSDRPWYVQLYKDGVKVRDFIPPSGSTTMDLTAYTEDFDSLRMANHSKAVPTNMMFVEGELPKEYVAYGSAENTVTTVTDEDVKKAFNNNAYQHLKEQGIPDDSFDFIDVHVCNLCDFSKAEQGYPDNKGQIVNYSVYCTDFIPVEEGATYYGVETWQSAFYDADKHFVKNFASADLVDGGITVPVGEGIAYMRNAGVSAKTVIMKGIKVSSYIPPTKSFRLLDDSARNDIRAQLMGTLGTRWFAVGDSITQGSTANTNYVNILNRDWLYNVTNYGLAGTRLTSTSNDSMCERIKTYDETKCDIITVFGGTNDHGVTIGTMDDTDTTTVYGALKDICNTFLTKYAGKRCGFITPLKYTAGEISAVTKAIKEVAAYYNIPVLDMESEFGHLFNHTNDTKTAFTSDGLHPNDAGQALMARKIAPWLLTL